MKLTAEKSGRKLNENEIEILSNERNRYMQDQEARKRSEHKKKFLRFAGGAFLLGGTIMIAKSCNDNVEKDNDKSSSNVIVTDTINVKK